jgi:hypothetical protein
MGLLGMMARTAVVAGTATAVSNRVSRRQVNRWNRKAEAQAYEQQQQAPQYQDQPPPPQYQQPQYQNQSPPAPESAPPAPESAPPAGPNIADEIQRLADLKDQGILSEDEFAAAKRKLLGI